MVRQTWTPDNLVGATRATSTLDFFQDRPVQVTEEDLAQRLRYTKAELISITLQKFSNLCTTKSRSSLHRLALGILLSSLACGGSQSNLPEGDLIEPEDFMIAVTGDPLRTNAMVFAHNGMLGYPVCKRIDTETG